MIDNTTLDHAGEIVIPAKHGQHVPSPYNTAFSADGKRLYVANITPAASVTVIDAVSKQVLSEIDMAACVLAYPSGNDRFTALCESGKALTVTLDANGKETKRTMSDAFIDVDKDPAFVNASRYNGGYLFTTYGGTVRSADFSGDKPAFGTPWPLLTDAERAEGWRPGGLQQTAVHAKQHRYYVLMHKGADGSHKDPGTQVGVRPEDEAARRALGSRATEGRAARVDPDQRGRQAAVLRADGDLRSRRDGRAYRHAAARREADRQYVVAARQPVRPR